MKNTTVEYTDEPMQVGEIVQDLFPNNIEFRFRELPENPNNASGPREEIRLMFSAKLFEQLRIEAKVQNVSVAKLVERLVTQGLKQLEMPNPELKSLER